MKKILVIDDQKDNLISIKAIMKNYMPECKILTAQSGAEGIVTAEEEEPDTILLDIIMPEMDGYEVCKKLKKYKLTKHIPVIMLTAIKTDSKSRIKGLTIGADAFLSKPIDPEELSAQVNVMLRIKEAEDKLRSEKVNLEELVEIRTKNLSVTNKKLRLEITERKQAEKNLDKEFQLRTALLDNIPDCIALILKKNTREIVASNKLARELSAVPGETCFNKCTKRDDKCPFCLAPKLWKTNQPQRIEVEYRGTWYEGIWEPLSEDLYVHYIYDISKRKQGEEALKESEERFKRLFNDLGDAVFVTKIGEIDRGQIVEVNPAAEKQTGYKHNELIGMNIVKDLAIFEPGEISHEKWDKKLLNGEFVTTTEMKKRKDGSQYWTEVVVTPIDYKGTKACLSINRDITERKQAEREIYRKTEDLALIGLLNDAVNKGKSLPEIIQLLSVETKKVYSSRGITLYLLSKDKEYLVMQNINLSSKTVNHIEKLIGMKIPAIRIPLIAGSRYLKTLQAGEVKLINDPNIIQEMMSEFTESKILKKLVPKIYKILDIRSVINTPLISEGEAIGLMDISRKEPFTESDLQRLKIVSEELTVIIKRKQVDEALQKSEKQFRGAFEQAAVGFVHMSIDGRLIRVNQRFCEIVGFSKKEVLKMSFLDFAHPDDSNNDMEIISRLLSNERENALIERRFRHKSGSYGWVNLSISIIHKLSGAPDYFNLVLEDITERKKTEEALQLTQSSVDNSTDAVYWMGPDAKFIYVNNMATEVLGYSKEELLRMTVHDISPEFPEEVWSTHWAELKEKKSFVIHTVHQRKNEGIFPVEITVNLIQFGTSEINCAIAKDITERKQAERELYESEERFRVLYNNSPDMYASVSPDDATILFCNETLLKNTGYSRKELFGTPIFKMYHDDCIDEVKKVFQQFVKTGRIKDKELILKRKDGSKIDVSLNANAIWDEAGKIIYSMSSWRDITERIRAETKLKNSEERFRQITENSQEWIWEVDKNGLYTFASQIEENMLGYKIEEIVGKKHFYDLFLPEDREELKKAAFEAFKQNQPFRDFINRNLTKKGEIVWLSTSGIPINDSDGNLIGYRGADINITERKLAEMEIELKTIELEKQFKKSEEQRIATLSALSDLTETTKELKSEITERKRAEETIRKLSAGIEQSPVSVVITDLKGTIEYVNPKFTQVTEYTLEEAKGQNPRFLKSGEHPVKFYKKMWDTITKGEIWRGEFHNKNKTGELFWEEATIGPITNDKGEITHYIALKEDITDRKKLEEQLSQSQKLESVGQLAGGIAHDFNNLLTIINGYSGLLIEEYDDDLLKKNLQQILKAGEKAAALTQQLLAFSRKQIIQPVVLNINYVIEETEKMLKRLIGEDISLKCILDEQVGYIKADAGQLNQILMNLTINARDAMPTGGNLTVETKSVVIDESYSELHLNATHGKYVMLSVSDNGIGMTEDVKLKIFEPFFTTKGIGKGTGLGLSTVYGIVKQHNGYIWVYSEPQKGTTFKVYLPLIEEENNSVSSEFKEIEIEGGSETILLVEDEPAVRNVTSQMLLSKGYNVLLAEDGLEALRIAKENKLDILITDVIMPGMSGPTLVAEIKRLKQKVKIIYISGYTDDTVARHGILKEGLPFIQKPFSKEDLLRIVRETLNKK